MSEWRARLYDSYVSSGQGGKDAASGFAARGPYLRDVIRRHVPADRKIRILDVGCGAGDVLFWLKKASYDNLQGFDVSPEMVSLAHESGVPEVALGSIAETLPAIGDETFDVVIAFDILEHFTKSEAFDILDGIFRVMKSGGVLVLHVPNAEGIFGAKIVHGDLTHETAFTQTSMRQTLSAVGFDHIRSYEDRPVVHGAKSAMRSLIWGVGSSPFRLLHAAETGSPNCILSQNF